MAMGTDIIPEVELSPEDQEKRDAAMRDPAPELEVREEEPADLDAIGADIHRMWSSEEYPGRREG